MAFDPYYTWLGIPPGEQPPHHYRLLGLTLFESNADAISNAGDRQMAHIRTFQSGPNAGASQQLLREIALARICLLDPQQKPAYDRQLRIKIARPTSETTEVRVVPQAKTDVVAIVPLPPSLAPAAAPQPARRKGKNGAAEVAKIMLGGIVGIALSVLLLRYGLEIDITGLLPVPSQRPIANIGQPPPAHVAAKVEPANSTPNQVSPITTIAPVPIVTPEPASPPIESPAKVAPAAKPTTKKGKVGSKGKKTGTVTTEPSALVEPNASNPPLQPSEAAGTLRPKRLPAPSDAERWAAAAQIEALFENPKPKTDADKLAVAAKLQALGQDDKSPAAERFAALWRATELAAASGEAAPLAAAMKALTQAFDVSPLAIEEPRLKEVAKSARTTAQIDTLVAVMKPAIDFSLAEGNYDAALSLANAAYSACNGTQGRQHQNYIAKGKTEITRQHAAWKASQAAQARLQADPEDAAAHLALAKWLIVERGDWLRGLPHLAKSSDPLTKSAAQAEMAGAEASQAQLALAESWYAAGQGPTKEALCLCRALDWFEQARRGTLQGLESAKADKRIDELKKHEGVKTMLLKLQAARRLGGLNEKLAPSVRRRCVLAFSFAASDVVQTSADVELIDHSSRQNHGRVSGPVLAAGRAGTAFQFDGQKDFVECPETPSLNPMKELTLCAWVRPEGWLSRSDALDYVISKDDWKGPARGYVLRFTDGGRLNLTLGHGGWSGCALRTAVPLQQWVHVAAVYDGKQVVLLVDGKEARSAAFPHAMNASPLPLRIGRGTYATERRFRGQIDEVAIFDGALAAADIQTLYELGMAGESLAR